MKYHENLETFSPTMDSRIDMSLQELGKEEKNKAKIISLIFIIIF